MEKQLYFAYGSNLSHDAMASRCPDSVAVGRATLPGWMLTFRGVADVEARRGARTHGVLWEISARDLERLDTYEGYPSLYRRELVSVQAEASELVAVTYVMNDDYTGLPSSSYFRTIKRGYEHWGLPLFALDFAVANVHDRLYDEGIRDFLPDGRKRLRPV